MITAGMWVLRIICPLIAVFALLNIVLAAKLGHNRIVVVQAIVLAVNVVLSVSWWVGPQYTLLFFMNASAGCYPWSPKTVPFHQHMTLCPGQETTVPVELAPPADDQPKSTPL